MFDTLIVFLKAFFEKLILKKSADNKKKNGGKIPGGKELFENILPKYFVYIAPNCQSRSMERLSHAKQ